MAELAQAQQPGSAKAGLSASGRVLRLPMNTEGRDFVIGDIHGAYDYVIEAMRLVKFDRGRDRLLCPGDLVDRGPDSARCARFLAQPYVKSVRGNHDDALVWLYKDGDPDPGVLDFISDRHHMEWWKTTPEDLRREILAALGQLPYVIEVPTRRGLVGIVHADVPMGMDWQTFTEHIELGTPEVLEVALNSRDRLIRSDRQEGVEGVGRVFVGHTPQRNGPSRSGNVYAMDTGAIFNALMGKEHYAMTMANVETSTAPLVQLGKGEMARVLVIDQSSDDPFGPYTQAPDRNASAISKPPYPRNR